MSDKWQPIESAPKDELILIWPTYSDGRPRSAKWRAMKRGFMVENGGRWEHGYGAAIPMKPTHWMPLPQPPDTTEET